MSGMEVWQMKLNKMREQMAEAFAHSLREDKIPWEIEWDTGRPMNPVTGKEYRGTNSLWLSYTADKRGYTDPRWCTYKQAQGQGWQVRRHETGTKIEFWSMYDTEKKKKLTLEEAWDLEKTLGKEYFDRVKPISSVYTVFNASQIDGIPQIEQKHDRLQVAEIMSDRNRLIKNMGVGFAEEGDSAFYRPSTDTITMPEAGRFKSEYGYISTFLHEAGHATGHVTRLNRDLTGSFGSERYAREELRAEIASAFTAQTLGLGIPEYGKCMDNHKAYIQSWAEILENSPKELFSAIKDAEHISDYLIEKGGFGMEQDLEVESFHKIDGCIEKYMRRETARQKSISGNQRLRSRIPEMSM